MKNINKQPSAFVSLISVLILGAIGLSVSVYIIIFSLSASKNSLSLVQSSQARALTSVCAERALEQIRELPTYIGTTNLSLSSGICSFTISNTGGETRTIAIIATVSSVVRRLSLTITAINPVISIGSWQETQ
ncbi:MAG: hypothetical protein WC564_02190 [Patescibacteria group bacterium]